MIHRMHNVLGTLCGFLPATLAEQSIFTQLLSMLLSFSSPHLIHISISMIDTRKRILAQRKKMEAVADEAK
jgi:uncharacterized membrane protein